MRPVEEPGSGGVEVLSTVDALEIAIVALEALLEDPSSSEGRYQRLFEDHGVILQTMGYANWTPRPRLPLNINDRRYLEPDFLAEDHTGRVEVIDLKTPNENILLQSERRQRFTAKVAEYVAQVHEYDEYFDSPDHRRQCEQLYDLVVAKRPPKILIIGRGENLDKSAVWRQLDRLASKLSIHTYDDVRDALLREHLKLSAGLEVVAGACIVLHFIAYRSPEDQTQYIWDLLGETGNRLSVYIEAPDVLVLELRTSKGTVFRAPVPSVAGGFEYDVPLLVQCAVGSYRGGRILQLRVEDTVAAELKVPGIDLSQELAFARGTMGNSVDYTAGGYFAMMECLMAHLPGFRDRLALVEYFLERRAVSSSAVVFSGEQGLDISKPIDFIEDASS